MKRWKVLSNLCKNCVVAKTQRYCNVRINDEEEEKPAYCDIKRMVSLGCRYDIEEKVYLDGKV